MDPATSQTLETVEAFLASQQKLFEKTKEDIQRLTQLRLHVGQRKLPLSDLWKQLESPGYRLSDAVSLHSGPPCDIHWKAFDKCDTEPLQLLALNIQTVRSQRADPSSKQCSELSPLQVFVKQARKEIIDPILPKYECILSDIEDEVEMDPVDLKREQEREKIRDLKRRQFQSAGFSLSTRHPARIFIRKDIEDESGEVDISFHDDPQEEPKCTDRPITTVSPETTPQSPTPAIVSNIKPARLRRPTVKAQRPTPSTSKPRKKAVSITLTCSSDTHDLDQPRPPQTQSSLGKRSRDGPKTETYKQAWSDSEQHLLERLLEEIPDGEKNRWLKISRAMDGRRTARQVASRVQKYFEKLKKFGIESR